MLEKTFRPQEVEAKHYAEWEGQGAFAADPQSNRNPFTVMMPPPNVTGHLHMGHALTFTLQDVLIRYQRMRGRDALWQPGTDHAGIATQMVVERELAKANLRRVDLGREAFLKRVWEWKAESGGAITHQLRRLGASPDWSRERFTLDEGLSLAVRKVFVALHEQGLIYRDKRLVNWDPKLHTAISDLEVVARETKGKIWHLRYPLADDPSRHIVVATTRPETMLGDTAIAVHPEDARYRDLIGKFAILPLADRKIPIIADLHADPETGSGAVKITPAHDFNDFEVGRRHNLPMVNIFDRDARLNESVPLAYRGLDRYAAREKILADLEALGLIERSADHVLMLPYGDRSGVVVEPWLTDQWYCDAKTLAAPAIRAVEEGRTQFVPKTWENTYFEWMRNIQPWCISRQLWWGHRIPAWYDEAGNVFVAMDEKEALAKAEKTLGRNLAPGELRQDEDVLDTWFSSALWPFSTLGWPEKTPELTRYYPGDVLVTGFDIIFFWVARMMMMGLHFMKDVPFRTVYIHALVRDERGQKMSKSKGNVIDPLEVIDVYGCDALRFTLCALAAQGRDIKMSESRVEGYRNFATKLWNATRFCQMNECRPDPAFDPAKVVAPVNRWMIGRLIACASAVDAAMAAYRYNEAASALYRCVWGEFCDWYLEFAKPILQGEAAAHRAETRAAIAWVLGQILHLLHPMMPFLTEELWGEIGLPGSAKLIRAPWPDYQSLQPDAAAMADIDWVVRLISDLRALRAETNLAPGVEIDLFAREASAAASRRLAAYGDLVRRLGKVGGIVIPAPETTPKGAAQIVLDDAVFLIPLAGLIDIGKERARLAKERAGIESEIEKIAKKLANPQFLAKADPEIVAEQKTREAELGAHRAKLDSALDRLATLAE